MPRHDIIRSEPKSGLKLPPVNSWSSILEIGKWSVVWVFIYLFWVNTWKKKKTHQWTLPFTEFGCSAPSLTRWALAPSSLARDLSSSAAEGKCWLIYGCFSTWFMWLAEARVCLNIIMECPLILCILSSTCQAIDNSKILAAYFNPYKKSEFNKCNHQLTPLLPLQL